MCLHIINTQAQSTTRGRPQTCMIVSKLKPMPFHNVNSPLLDPVSSRRPSGVHRTMLIGCLILFKDECRCFAGIVSAGLSSFAAGGSIYSIRSVRVHMITLAPADV